MNEMMTNWIILVDCTENMEQKDFRPNRFQVALKGVQKFIQMKFKLFPEEFLSLYLFSDKTQILAQLSRNSQEILKQLMSPKFNKSHHPKGNGEELFFALQHAVESIRSQIKIIGGQKNRIIIITGLNNLKINTEFADLIEVMSGLNIAVDFFILSNNKTDKMAVVTNFNPIYNKLQGNLNVETFKSEFFEHMISYSKKQDLLVDVHPTKQKDGTTSSELIEIAQDLRKPTAKEKEQLKDPLSMLRCQICFSKKSPIDQKQLKITGRFCPHCGTPMHLSCAGMWTDKTDEGANLFRCPYCYTLLKIPMYILKGIRSRKFLTSAADRDKFTVKMIKVKVLPPQMEDMDCAYCQRPIKDPERDGASSRKLYKCSHCNALYHVDCLSKMYKKSKICECCGRKIV